MSPADGGIADFGRTAASLAPDLAIILPGGRTLLALSQLDQALPRRGFCGEAQWRAMCWPARQGLAGLALVDAPLTGTGRLRAASGEERDILAPRLIDVAPAPLAAFVRYHGLNIRAVFDFLIDMLVASPSGEPRDSDRDFAGGFLSLAAEAGGFIEILACPDSGGLFAQGWAMSLSPGRHRLARLDGALELCEADVAGFARDDILPPGTGFCLFSRDWRGVDFETIECLFYEQDDRLMRLEVVRGSVQRLRGAAATDHVQHMLPRLECDAAILGAYNRICRPRYPAADTLSATTLPIAAAFDAVFQAPSGGLLAMGWLLDPLRHVERVIIKSTRGLYAPLHDGWNPLPRADLNEGFAGDPRFARFLDAGDTTHGFIAFAEGEPPRGDDEFYLELVLGDGSCLFRPLTVTRLDGRELLPQLLHAVPLHDPALDRIASDTLAPFLAALPARPQRPRQAQRPMPLSTETGEITAVIPLARFDHLQPMMALLSGTAEALRLDLVIVMARAEAQGVARRLRALFGFYGLRGRLLLVPDQLDPCSRIEAGLALAKGARVLLWSPEALPATPGWLALLEADLDGLGARGLISPTLTYEDGSIFHGADVGAGSDAAAMLGYPAGWLRRGAPSPTSAGAAQLALVDREALADAGGLAGRLYSDAMVHRDLARRLHACGHGTWASPAVDFWMLEDRPPAADGILRLLETIDSVLLVHDARAVTENRPR